jgi:hypothetical protein
MYLILLYVLSQRARQPAPLQMLKLRRSCCHHRKNSVSNFTEENLMPWMNVVNWRKHEVARHLQPFFARLGTSFKRFFGSNADSSVLELFLLELFSFVIETVRAPVYFVPSWMEALKTTSSFYASRNLCFVDQLWFCWWVNQRYSFTVKECQLTGASRNFVCSRFLTTDNNVE